MLRSFLAVLAGLVAIPCVVGLADRALQAAMPHAFDAGAFGKDAGVLWITLAYVTVLSGPCGWLTALISRREDLRDVLILAGLQCVLTIVATVAKHDPQMVWYCVLCAIFPPAAIIAGGWLRIHRTHRTYRSGPPAGVTA